MNLIQVFGLRRSGTNLIENMVLNHFDDMYEMIPVFQNVHPLHAKQGQPESLKHTLPTLTYSEYVIIIFKPYEAWSESIRKRYGKEDSIHVWESFHRRAIDLFLDFPRQVIVADWYDVAVNYKDFVQYVSDKFELTLIDIKDRPAFKMGTLSGTNITGEPFNVKPYGEIKERETLTILNGIKWMN